MQIIDGNLFDPFDGKKDLENGKLILLEMQKQELKKIT